MTTPPTPKTGWHGREAFPALRRELDVPGEDLLRGTEAVFLEVVEWYASIPDRFAAGARMGRGVGSRGLVGMSRTGDYGAIMPVNCMEEGR
jgi:hypothetical protein